MESAEFQLNKELLDLIVLEAPKAIRAGYASSLQNSQLMYHLRHFRSLLCISDWSNVVKPSRSKNLHTDGDCSIVKIPRLDLGHPRHSLWLGVKARPAF